MTNRRFAWLTLFIGFLLINQMACSGGGGGSQGSTLPTVNDSASSTIGSAGGILTTPSGSTTLNVSANALNSNILITISQSTEGDPPGGLIGSYEFKPDGLTFNNSATISVKYDSALIPEGISETDLKLAYASSGEWIIISNSTVDTVNHIVNAQVTHFSKYAPIVSTKVNYSSDGLEVGEFNGVKVYSNGSVNNVSNEYNSYNSINTGMKWQCVEYVNRYYLQVYGKDIRVPGTDAQGYYNVMPSQKSLVAYPNDGSEPPQQGDIIVSEGTPGNVGHVAIVREVSADKIYVVQQNWFQNGGDNKFLLSRSGNHINSFGGSKSYPIKGWLRLPGTSSSIIAGLWYGGWQHKTNVGIVPVIDRWGNILTTLAQNGTSISGSMTIRETGSCTGTGTGICFSSISGNLSGSINGNNVVLTSGTQGDVKFDLNGTVSGNTIQGNYILSGGACNGESGTWSINKITEPTIEPWGAIIVSPSQTISLTVIGGSPPYTISSSDAQNVYDSTLGDGSWTVAENGGTFIVRMGGTAGIDVKLSLIDAVGTPMTKPVTLFIR